MTDFRIVDEYILNNIYHNDLWKELSDEDKQVVVNHAEAMLYRELPHHFRPETKPIPMDVLAEQCLHLLQFDDSVKRAELGVSYFFTSGLYVSFDKDYMDRTIARTILHRYPRRRVARTVVSPTDTYRAYTHVRNGNY